MSKRDDKLLVIDIVDSLKAILEYTKGMSYDDFQDSRITVDAVIRNFEIVSEASNMMGEEFKRKIRRWNGETYRFHKQVNPSLFWNTI